MELQLIQKEVASIIGVSTDCITYWGNGRSTPRIQFMPKIVRFLGYYPVQADGDGLGFKVKQYRIKRGLSHKRLGKILGVDASTVGSWEMGKFKPNRKIQRRLEEILSTT
ncbi:MAG: transcriptional regulator [Chitinophagaceae bacterium]|nr:transcriptional regulator [Chitinophagaceae bacterium]